LWITEDVVDLGVMVIRRGLLFIIFLPMRNASAKDLEMKTPFNNNLHTQIGDVIINPGNPVNPDSKCHETVTSFK